MTPAHPWPPSSPMPLPGALPLSRRYRARAGQGSSPRVPRPNSNCIILQAKGVGIHFAITGSCRPIDGPCEPRITGPTSPYSGRDSPRDVRRSVGWTKPRAQQCLRPPDEARPGQRSSVSARRRARSPFKPRTRIPSRHAQQETLRRLATLGGEAPGIAEQPTVRLS
jgi:hypothetical protein